MLDTAIKAVRLASKIFEDSFGNVKDIMVKEGKEFFTDIDLACEKVIIDTIRGKFPDHNIWSEECGSLEKSDSDYEWIIDPLDGTNNYIHSVPLAGISIGLMCKDKPVLGVVYFPLIKQFFSAEHGKGAFLNGKRISVSNEIALNKSFLLFDSHFKHFTPKFFAFFDHLTKKVFRTRIFGSACFNICSIACGSANICVESDLKPGDITASAIIAEEAGAIITDHAGNPWNLHCRDILVANSSLHKKVLNMFK